MASVIAIMLRNIATLIMKITPLCMHGSIIGMIVNLLVPNFQKFPRHVLRHIALHIMQQNILYVVSNQCLLWGYSYATELDVSSAV